MIFIKFKQLQYFRVLARNLHYSKTAEELNIAQSTLSRVIAQLESDLGVYLFEKKGRNIVLTKSGEIFLEYVERGLTEIEMGEKIMHESQNPTAGIIDLGFVFSLGPECIPKLVKKFLGEKKYNYSFNFYQGNTSELLGKLKSNKCDLVLCSYVCNEPEIEFNHFLTQELVIIASVDHPIAQLDSISLSEISKYPFILPIEKDSYIESLFSELDIKLNVTYRVQEDSTIIGLVSENYGISILAKNNNIYNKNIKVIKIKERCTNKVYLANLKNHYLNPAPSKLKSFILNQKKYLIGYNEIE